jgi:RNA polymerase sigma-70 factor (ECF subfamily)
VAQELKVVPDETLVRRAQADDERAFGELIERYETKVYSLALKMLRNPEDAEDVLQDTFLGPIEGQVVQIRRSPRGSTALPPTRLK